MNYYGGHGFRPSYCPTTKGSTWTVDELHRALHRDGTAVALAHPGSFDAEHLVEGSGFFVGGDFNSVYVDSGHSYDPQTMASPLEDEALATREALVPEATIVTSLA